jgi:hypothetical protein
MFAVHLVNRMYSQQIHENVSIVSVTYLFMVYLSAIHITVDEERGTSEKERNYLSLALHKITVFKMESHDCMVVAL